MASNFKNLIKYYRNSVADGERMDIPAKECDNGFKLGNIFKLQSEELSTIYKKLYESQRKSEKTSKNIKEEEDEEKYPIDIFLTPFYLSAKHEHAVKNTNIQKVYPFWLSAKITEQGSIIVDPEQVRLPWFVRSVLEPVCFDTNYFPVISSITKVDQSLDAALFNIESWEEYLESSNTFFKKVTDYELNDFQIDGFNTHHSTCIIKAKTVVSAKGIIRLYDDIINDDFEKNLIQKFTTLNTISGKEIPEKEYLFTDISHYGQYNNRFSLSTSQRISLCLFEREQQGETLAVNGPPGTGKTTLLQSIVANEIVKAVGNQDSPPLILAASTNNQAITNILDNFGTEGGVIDRWLPNLTSLGMYMISSDKNKQKQALKKGYQLLTRDNDFFDGHYFHHFHRLDIDELKEYYINKFQQTSDSNLSNIKDIVYDLAEQVQSIKNFIKYVFKLLGHTKEIQAKYFAFDLIPDKRGQMENLTNKIEEKETAKRNIFDTRNKLETFIASNKLLYFFSFIPFFRKRFSAKLQLNMLEVSLDRIDFSSSITNIRTQIIELVRLNKEALESLANDSSKQRKAFDEVTKAENQWKALTSKLDMHWKEYLSSLSENSQKIVNDEYRVVGEIEQLNRILDVSYRHKAFILSIHFWEGKYIQYIENADIKISKGQASKEEQFKLMSFLTPLFISTFHSAPNYASHWNKTSDKWIQKPIYELFDLLIVDEAGQVAPEIGTASFALAKKALVVGDIYQIEPVWNIPYLKVDEGNLRKYNVLDNNNLKDIKEKGILCSSGNLMRLAQNTSGYFTNDQLKGSLLTEHRRCVDELVQFSNAYVYNNLLEPKIGSFSGKKYGDKQQLFLPPLAYLHVNGISEQKSGSNFNVLEATTITQWILLFGNSILATINADKKPEEQKKLKDVIAIVTPFTEQKNEINRQFLKNKVSTDITVGTVHALQGAEREIILFSPVYGKNHNGSLFFDMGFNMLNVAITRAKKHFIVIGNMSLFDISKKSKPSGALASYLFASPENELSGSFLYNSPLIKSDNRISTLNKHIKALRQSFVSAKKRLIICSPFIRINAINSDNLTKHIRDAINRNVKITILTDKFLDTFKGILKEESEKGRNALLKAGAKLEIKKGIHNKTIAIDDKFLIEGSFNWLSAIRDEAHPFYRYDASQIIQGEEAKIQINQLIDELKIKI